MGIVKSSSNKKRERPLGSDHLAQCDANCRLHTTAAGLLTKVDHTNRKRGNETRSSRHCTGIATPAGDTRQQTVLLQCSLIPIECAPIGSLIMKRQWPMAAECSSLALLETIEREGETVHYYC